MKIALLGCGSIGERHLKNILALGYRDITVFDPNAKRLSKISTDYPVVVCNSQDEIHKKDPDVTIITSPTGSHFQNIMDVLRHTSSNIFVEKPIIESLKNAAQLVSQSSRKNILIMTGCNFRFHPSIKIIKDLLEAKAIGKTVSAYIEVGSFLPDWHPWEDYRNMYSARKISGGGCILDAIHEIDYSNWLFGDAVEVASFNGNSGLLDIETEDIADILVRYQNGMVATIHMDYLQRRYSRQCKVIGAEGTITWEFDRKSVQYYDAKRKELLNYAEPPDYVLNDMYIAEMEYFLSSVQAGRKCMSNIEEALAAVRIAEAAKTSQERGCFIKLEAP